MSPMAASTSIGEDDRTPPNGAGRPVFVYVSTSLHEALVCAAADEDVPLATAVRRALRAYVRAPRGATSDGPCS